MRSRRGIVLEAYPSHIGWNWSTVQQHTGSVSYLVHPRPRSHELRRKGHRTSEDGKHSHKIANLIAVCWQFYDLCAWLAGQVIFTCLGVPRVYKSLSSRTIGSVTACESQIICVTSCSCFYYVHILLQVTMIPSLNLETLFET